MLDRTELDRKEEDEVRRSLAKSALRLIPLARNLVNFQVTEVNTLLFFLRGGTN